MITVGEYVAWHQPEVAAILGGRIVAAKEVEEHPFSWWKQLMETPYYKENQKVRVG